MKTAARGSSVNVTPFRGPIEEWDEFVRGQDGWSPFHLHAWRDVMREVHGHDTPYLAARGDDGELRAVLPLVRVRSPVFGHYLVSMPFVNYGGALGEPEAVEQLVEGATDLARDEDADLLELRNRREIDAPLQPSHEKITVIRDLPEEGSEALWDDFDPKVRNQVRKPRKEGVTVEFGRDQLAPFYEVFSRHMRDLGTPAQPRQLFEAAADALPGRTWFGCAWLDGKPVAGGAGFRWNGEFEMTWASDLFDYRKIAPNMLLYWSFMERACEEGLERFNFGRCTPGSGTHRFKKQWGTRDEQLWWYRWSSGEVDSAPSPDDEEWSWGPKIWRKLPVPVATALGPRIVRYIP